MDAKELAFAGIAEQARLIDSGQVSSRELVELYIERIERFDSDVKAFRVLFAEQALEQARAVERTRTSGGGGPLLGVPVAVKDDTDVAGQVTAMGSNAFGGPATEDAEIVKRLRAAGAIIIGKTNVPELCMWPFTETVAWGSTRNPWDLQRAPGGSSGGSGAAVAAGLVGAATGSDGAGSIRIPSAWCGLFGCKTQRGRVPGSGGWHGMSVNGLLGRNVADTALFLDVLGSSAGPAGGDGASSSTSFVQAAAEGRAAEASAGGRRRLRICFSKRIPPGILTTLDSDAERCLMNSVELLRSLGHTVEERDPDYPAQMLPALLVRMFCGIADEARQMARPARLERRTRAMARIGTLIPRSALRWSFEREGEIAARLNAVLSSHDVLITPATAKPPPPLGQFEGAGALRTFNGVARLVPFNAPWNLTGQPACSVPAGFGADGLPRAIQLVGRASDERTLLALAAELEREQRWPELRPARFA